MILITNVTDILNNGGIIGQGKTVRAAAGVRVSISSSGLHSHTNSTMSRGTVRTAAVYPRECGLKSTAKCRHPEHQSAALCSAIPTLWPASSSVGIRMEANSSIYCFPILPTLIETRAQGKEAPC